MSPGGTGPTPSGGGAGSRNGANGASSAAVSAAKCRRSAAELAHARGFGAARQIRMALRLPVQHCQLPSRM